MSARTGEEKRKRRVGDITIAQTDSDKRYVQALRAREELNWINDFLNRDDLVGASLRFEGRDAKDVIKHLTKRRTELRKQLASRGLDPDMVVRYARRARTADPNRPLIMANRDPSSQRSLNLQVLLSIITEQQAVNCNTISMGQVHASDIRFYSWSSLEVSGSKGGYWFWPLSQLNPAAQESYAGDWSGETGAFFWIWVDVPAKSWAVDPMDGLDGAAVLQFTIPAPQCDATLHWGTRGVVEGVATWLVYADYGRLTSDWVLHESPGGGDFPAALVENFEFINEGVYVGPAGVAQKSALTPFERSFAVQAGVSPRIYLGCSLLALAINGRVSTRDFGVGDYFEFENGITYCMVSQQP